MEISADILISPNLDRCLYEFAKLGEHVRPVTTILAKVTPDRESKPFIYPADLPVASGAEFFARVLSKKQDGMSGAFTFFRTGSSNRADYFAPIIFKVRSGKDRAMSAIMTKGSGSLKALEETGSPFAARSGGEIEGSATIKDCRLDAINSQKLDKAGIRTRVALGVWQLDEMEYEGKVYDSPQKLIEAGLVSKPEDLPAIGVFASRTALKLEDIRFILASSPLESPETEGLITYLIRTTEYDDALKFKGFFNKYKGVVAEKNRVLPIISPEDRRRILTDYSIALARVLGQQAAKFEKIKAIKTVQSIFGISESETLNNFTCLGESVDNSGVIWEANTAQIANYQESLLSYANLIPDFLRLDLSTNIEVKHNTAANFIEGYLDEMTPGWRESKTGEQFLLAQSQELEVDLSNAHRAYWIVKIKLEKLKEEKGSSTTDSRKIANLTYNLLSCILPGDRLYEKSDRFLDKFLEVGIT